VPLTLEDVLHPEVGDFIVHSDRHETDRMYLTAVLRARLEEFGAAIVLGDVRIAWDGPACACMDRILFQELRSARAEARSTWPSKAHIRR